ncbi:MAG: AAA family ATPase [Proteobacteria bacterium]|nr:AAA family ATPase [Pseudomonadota bacterium]
MRDGGGQGDNGGAGGTLAANPGAGAGSEPFGESASVDAYVPRDATEAALSRAQAALATGGRVVAVTGPPGIGKTLVLQLALQRLSHRFAGVYLPYGAMSFEDLCGWALGGLGEAPGPADSLRRRAEALCSQGAGLLLVIDDAASMPAETTRALAAEAASEDGGLRVLVAAHEDAAASRMLAAMLPEPVVVRLAAPMTEAETALYLRSQLERSGAPPAERQLFDREAIEQIHTLGGGIPRLVNREAAALLRRDAPEGVQAVWREESWMGAPLDGEGVGDLDDGPLLDPEKPELDTGPD